MAKIQVTIDGDSFTLEDGTKIKLADVIVDDGESNTKLDYLFAHGRHSINQDTFERCPAPCPVCAANEC